MVEEWIVTLKDVGSSPAGATFDDSFGGKLTENCSENSFAGEQKTVGKFRSQKWVLR